MVREGWGDPHLNKFFLFFVFFFKFLEDMSPFCGATDTPVLDSGDVSSGLQSQNGQPYLSLQRHMCYMFPEIHLWCDTCQHGSRDISSTYLRGIGGT